MGRLFKEYRRTKEIQKELDAEQVQIKDEADARLESIRSVQAELESAAKQFADPAIAESVKVEIARDRTLRLEDAIALERERHEFIERKHTQTKETTNARKIGLISEIRAMIEEMARREDYDFVFDSSGLTVSQVPFFLHATASKDLTDAMLEELNRDREPDAGGQTKTEEGDQDAIKETN